MHFYDLNIKASRCNFAKMHLNGKYHGVYVNVERIDTVFIKKNFADGGALYKSDKGGAGGNLEPVIQLSDPNARRGLTLEPKSPSVHTDARDVLELICQTLSDGGDVTSRHRDVHMASFDLREVQYLVDER